jgi:hypothetical protein
MRLIDAVGVLLAGGMTACCAHGAPPSQFPTANDALARMKESFACTNGVQGTAKIDSFSPRGRIRGDLYLFAMNPDRVRFDIVSPFGATLYTLTSDGDRFEMLDVKEKQFLHGPSSPCNLARLTQVPVPAHALVALLRGEAPVLVHEPAAATIAWDKDRFYRILVQSSRDATEEIHLEVNPDDFSKPWKEQRLRVTLVRVNQRGVDLYQAEMGSHEPAHRAEPRTDPDGIEEPIAPSGGVCDVELPRSIRMRVPNTQEDVIFQYKEARWNPPLLPGAFQQPVPSGVNSVYVTCDDNKK